MMGGNSHHFLFSIKKSNNSLNICVSLCFKFIIHSFFSKQIGLFALEVSDIKKAWQDIPPSLHLVKQ
jgi:hypothetical protein